MTPLFEGRRLATQLRRAGLEVTLCTDAQAYVLMPHVDQVLCGADAILKNGDVINKVGSVQLALAARELQRPVILAAESLKQARECAEHPETRESNPADEVWSGRPSDIQISNIYFERIPRRLIDEIITEYGPLD